MIFMLKKYKVILFASFICAATLLTSCVQTTKSMFGEDRNQLLLVSEAELNKEAQSSYNQVLSEARSKGILNTDEVNRARVNGVSQRLIAVAPELRADAASWKWVSYSCVKCINCL